MLLRRSHAWQWPASPVRYACVVPAGARQKGCYGRIDSSGRNELSLLETILPLVLGIAGAVALVAGILLARKPHQDIAAEPAGTSPESAADAAPATEHAAPATEHSVTEDAVTQPAAGVPANATAEAPSEAPAERSIVPGLDGEPPAR
jgi:hypothetical protein